MSRVPSGCDVYASLPRGEWFRLPDQIDRIYPDIPEYYRSNVLNKALRKLTKEMGWGNVARTGRPGDYEFLIMEGSK